MYYHYSYCDFLVPGIRDWIRLALIPIYYENPHHQLVVCGATESSWLQSVCALFREPASLRNSGILELVCAPSGAVLK